MLGDMQPIVLAVISSIGLWTFFTKLFDNVKTRKLRFIARSLAEKVSLCRQKAIQADIDITDWPNVDDSEIV